MTIDRRGLIRGALAASAAGLMLPTSAATAAPRPITRAIPSTGESMPIVGLGSWITFNVGNDPKLLDECADVIKAFIDGGGRMIDSSPMYGSAQSTIGYGLKKLGHPGTTFSADKVWISDPAAGPQQMTTSRNNWGVERLDLMQVHNLLSWEAHLETLRQMKSDGQVRYIGITTSHGRRHRDLVRIIEREDIDFVQVTYNIADRDVEARILPLAKERGVGVIVNRPYRRGGLIQQFRNKALPSWADETGAKSWAQFLLRFVISHPAVTCAIPATTKVAHLRENLAAASGPLPDARLRERMAAYVRDL